MVRVQQLSILVFGLVAACGATTPRLTIPEFTATERLPDTPPSTRVGTPKLVVYPGLDVSYVANSDGEIYFCRKRYFCYFSGNWFRAATLNGPWSYVEMKYVPSDLFRVRGHLPPALERQRRG